MQLWNKETIVNWDYGNEVSTELYREEFDQELIITEVTWPEKCRQAVYIYQSQKEIILSGLSFVFHNFS